MISRSFYQGVRLCPKSYAGFGAPTKLSTLLRRHLPRKRKSDLERDRLVQLCRSQGMSNSLIEAELDSHGLKPGPSIERVQNDWPTDEEGQPIDYGAPPDTSKEWEHLAELVSAGILTEEQFDWLKLKKKGYNNVEICEMSGVSSNEQTRIAKDIAAAIQDFDERLAAY